MLLLLPESALFRTCSRTRWDQTRPRQNRKSKELPGTNKSYGIKVSPRIVLLLSKIHTGFFKDSKTDAEPVEKGCLIRMGGKTTKSLRTTKGNVDKGPYPQLSRFRTTLHHIHRFFRIWLRSRFIPIAIRWEGACNLLRKPKH